MRFLFLSTGYSPEPGGGHLLQELAEQLAGEGHEVDFLVADPLGRLPRGPLPSQTPGLRAANIGRSWSFVPAKGPLKYIAPNLSAWFDGAWLKWLRDEYDLLLVATPVTIYSATLARVFSSTHVRVKGLIVWDFFPIAQLEAGAVTAPGFERALFWAENRIVRQMDVYFVLTPMAGDFLRSYYSEATGATEVLRPWGPDLVEGSASPGAHDHLTVVWGGNFIARRAVEDLLRVAEESMRRGLSVRFLLAGDGATRGDYERMAERLGLTNVEFVGRLDRASYLELLAEADIATSLLTESTSPCFPSKTVDYCQVGLPLLVTCESGNDYGAILEACGAGKSFAPGQIAPITDWLQSMCAPHGRIPLAEMGRASRALFERELDVEAAARIVVHTAGVAAIAALSDRRPS